MPFVQFLVNKVSHSKERSPSKPQRSDRRIQYPNTLYRENIVDEFVEKIIDPQLEYDSKRQDATKGRPRLFTYQLT